MTVLVWKELRLASDLILGASILFVASFPLAFAGVAMQGVRPFPWLSALAGGCILNQYTMVLTGALLGAVAFAREREDGNTAFLAMLPLHPRRHFAAKVLACLTVWSVLWAVNAIAFSLTVLLTGEGLAPLFPFLPHIMGIIAFSFAAMGLAALAGNFVDKVVGAAFSGGGALALLAFIRMVWRGAAPDGAFFSPGFSVLLATAGLAGFALAYVGFQKTRGARRTRVRSRVGAGNAPTRGHRGPRGALLWKEFRLMRSVLAAGAALFLLPFFSAAAMAVISGHWPKPFLVASLSAMVLGWLILPLWAAVGLAGEWEAGTHKFLAALPVPPRRALLVKFAAAALPAAIVLALPVAAFLWAHAHLPGEPGAGAATSWDQFNSANFLGGAVAYAGAMPVTFGAAWYFAARLRRTIVAIILGALAGPVAMALWALTGGPGGHFPAHVSPLSATGLHVLLMLGMSAGLVTAGSLRTLRAASQ